MCIFIAPCIAQNPAIRGVWKGFLLSDNLDVDNRKGLPVTLTITDDNNAGNIVGEMLVKYRYQEDIYKAKYAINGSIDYSAYKIALQQTNIIYSDLLPKGLQWCLGNGTFHIFRSTYKKKVYIDGYMLSDCGAEKMRMILIKQ